MRARLSADTMTITLSHQPLRHLSCSFPEGIDTHLRSLKKSYNAGVLASWLGWAKSDKGLSAGTSRTRSTARLQGFSLEAVPRRFVFRWQFLGGHQQIGQTRVSSHRVAPRQPGLARGPYKPQSQDRKQRRSGSQPRIV